MIRGQCGNLLEYMRTHDRVTQEEIGQRFGIKRLASRINDLQNRGCVIRHEMVPAPSRWGKADVAAYTLISEPEKLPRSWIGAAPRRTGGRGAPAGTTPRPHGAPKPPAAPSPPPRPAPPEPMPGLRPPPAQIR